MARLEPRTNKRGYLVYETPDAKICKGKECTECREIKQLGHSQTHQKAAREVLQEGSWHNVMYVETRP